MQAQRAQAETVLGQGNDCTIYNEESESIRGQPGRTTMLGSVELAEMTSNFPWLEEATPTKHQFTVTGPDKGRRPNSRRMGIEPA
jgi:hypothetical protein